MRITKARRVAEIARDTRGDWTVQHGRYAATLPATGPEVDAWLDAGKPLDVPDGPDFGREAPARVVRLATKVVTRERHKPTPTTQWPHNTGWFAHLDGEERVELYPITTRPVDGDPKVVVARITCSSPHCRDVIVQTEEGTGREVGRYQRAWSRLVVWFPNRPETDPRMKPGYAGGVERSGTDVEGRDPHQVKGEHIAWHREAHGVHPRVELDRWLAAHPGFGWEEPDRAEIDNQLSIARAEQAAERGQSG